MIAAPEAREALTATIFRETTTIGVRYRDMTRECLDRRTVTVTTSVGDVRIKVAARNGQIAERVAGVRGLRAPCRASTTCPAKNVQAMAMKAWLDAPRE